MRLLAAVPAGSTKAKHAARWLRAVEAHPDAAALRTDSLRTLRAVAWHLARRARPDGTSAPGWDGLQDGTGMSRATVARWLRWLRERGLLGIVETGSTAATRGRAAVLGDDGNRAAIYLLCERDTAAAEPPAVGVPPGQSPVEEHETPRLIPVGDLPPQARAHAVREASPRWSRTAQTHTRRDELDAAAALRAASLDLRRLSPRHVRSLVRDLLREGWTVADVVHAIDHDPDGTPRRWTGVADAPAGWLRSRLAAWSGQEPPSAIAARTHRQQREEQAAARVAIGLAPVAASVVDQVRTDALAAAAATAQWLRSRPQVDPAATAAGVAACRAALAEARARRAG